MECLPNSTCNPNGRAGLEPRSPSVGSNAFPPVILSPDFEVMLDRKARLHFFFFF